MKKLYSAMIGMFMLFGNGAISSFFPEPAQAVVEMLCICVGVVCIYVIVKEGEEYRISRNVMVEKLIEGIDSLGEGISRLPSWKQIEKVCNDNSELLNGIQSALTQYIDMNSDAVNKLLGQIQTNQKELTEIVALIEEQIRLGNTKNIENVMAVFNSNTNKIIQNVKHNNQNVITVMKESYVGVCKKDEATKAELKNIYAAVADGNVTTEKIVSCLDLLKDMPDELYQMYDELFDKLAADEDEHCKMLQDLCENLNDNNKLVVQRIGNGMQDIVELIDMHESELSAEIKKLAQQYNVFKEYTQELIKKMTLMSSEDYKLLKGLMDGKQRK